MRSFAMTSYLQYFLSGLVITTIGSVMPQLLVHYGISYTEGGRLVFLGSVGFLIGVPLSSYLMVRMNEKTVLSIAALLIAVAQLGMFTLPSFGLVTAFNFINSIGVAALETVVATLMMEVFVGRRAVVMSYLEVSFGLGALLMPIIASILIANGAWKYSFLFTAALAAAMTVIWRFVSFAKDKADVGEPLDASAPPPHRMTARKKWQLLALFGFMIILYSGIEGSLNNFLSSVFIGYLDQVPYYASLSIGIFWTAMVIGRAATGWIIRKMSYGRFLLWSMAGTLAGFIGFIVMQNAAAGYALVTLLGFTMAGVYSITMVYANHTFPGSERFVTSYITGLAGFGGAVLPALTGYVMDHAETAVALWLVAAFAALFIAALLTIFALYQRVGAVRRL
ncbi:MFS transporter [Paenibacillus contaminans]|uniref:MFS transporter n=1 Tax=Paenibacillus contaminans TaxID=450362 RepID=A0A329MUY6_9BACL|nr:MFS transporter [Paenibacillus contaminans]RAV22483.1 MFS transporter [Paenibacillus contaminans]